MSQKYRRYSLRSKEAKAILDKASERTKVDVEKIVGTKANIEAVEAGFDKILLINNKPLLFRSGENVFPTLFFKEIFASAPKIVVDMGAIPHICNGADIMAPGIVRFEGEFGKGDLVQIIDEKYGKLLAIGEINYDAQTAKNIKQGVIVKNIHYVGDRIWNFAKNLANKLGESKT
jgi:PUA-domain protein